MTNHQCRTANDDRARGFKGGGNRDMPPTWPKVGLFRRITKLVVLG